MTLSGDLARISLGVQDFVSHIHPQGRFRAHLSRLDISNIAGSYVRLPSLLSHKVCWAFPAPTVTFLLGLPSTTSVSTPSRRSSLQDSSAEILCKNAQVKSYFRKGILVILMIEAIVPQCTTYHFHSLASRVTQVWLASRAWHLEVQVCLQGSYGAVELRCCCNMPLLALRVGTGNRKFLAWR